MFCDKNHGFYLNKRDYEKSEKRLYAPGPGVKEGSAIFLLMEWAKVAALLVLNVEQK